MNTEKSPEQHSRRSSLKVFSLSPYVYTQLNRSSSKSLSGSPQTTANKARSLVIPLQKRVDVNKERRDVTGQESSQPGDGTIDNRPIQHTSGKQLAANLARKFSSSVPNLRPPLSKRLLETYLSLKMASNLPRISPETIKTIALPPPSKSKTVVFDLDETLVHRCESLSNAEVVLHVTLPTREVVAVGVNVRPYAINCLQALSQDWEVIVFTASQKCYADAVLDYLDPKKVLVAHRLYREHCLHFGSTAVKDLRLLPNRQLSSTVIIDNAAHSFAYQLDNGIPIRPWKNNPKDRELLKLAGFLRRLATVQDVRVELRRTFDLGHFCEDFQHAYRKGSDQS